MRQRSIPGTDLSLSVVGLGCWTLGGRWWGPDVDPERGVATIHAALDAGINWVDTAPIYGDADAIVARALCDRPEVIVATKCGVRTDGDHARSELDAAHVIADVEASLRRLGRDRLDLVQVHWPCENGTPLAETIGALERLQERGDVRYHGLCNHSAAALAEARGLGQVVSLQTPLSLLRREFEGDLQAECRIARSTARGDPPTPCGVLVYETLCRGLLTGRFKRAPQFPESDLRARDMRFSGPRFAHARALVHDLGRVAQKVGATPAALAVGWAADRPGVTASIVGARSPVQIQQSAGAARLIGRKKLWSVVDRVAALHGGWPR